MNEIHKIEIEKMSNAGTPVRKDKIEKPAADAGNVETENNSIGSEQEEQARESEKAFEEALTRLPPG